MYKWIVLIACLCASPVYAQSTGRPLAATLDSDLNSLASGITGVVKGLGNGSGFTAAVAGTDYLSPGAIGTTVMAYNAGLNLLGLLSDPNADRIPFWDDSANTYAWLTAGTGLSISGTTMTATGLQASDIGVSVQAFDADLSDLADGSLTGTKVGFADTDNNFAATNVQAAIEELDNVNGSGVNAADGKIDWTQLVNVPAGFADGTDAGAGAGSGTLNTIKENDVQLGGSDIATLDFLGADFDLTESPDTEVNVIINSGITRDTEIDTSAEIRTLVGDEDGTGALLFDGASPAFVDLDANIGTLASASDPFTLTQTWNNGAVTFEALRINITSTANVNGSKAFAIYDDGNLVASFDNLGMINAHYYLALGGGGGNPVDTLIQRAAAHHVIQANGGNSQKFMVADTAGGFPVSTYEAIALQFTSNVAQIGTIDASGTDQPLAIMTNGTNRWVFGANDNHLVPATDSSSNLGAPGTEIQNIYVDTLNLTNDLPIASGGTGASVLTKAKQLRIFGPTTNVATITTGLVLFSVPPELNGYNLVSVHVLSDVAGTTGTTDTMITRTRSGSTVDMLSAVNQVASTKNGSDEAGGAAGTVNGSNDDVATYDIIKLEIDNVQSTPAQGYNLTLNFEKP